MYHSFSINSSVSGHLGCLHILTIVHIVAMNIGVHVSFRIVIFSGYMPSSGIAGSYGNFISSFLRNLHTVLHSHCITLHSHEQCQRFLSSSLHLPHLLFVDFFNGGHSDRFVMIPHCSFDLSFSNNKNVDQFFMCLLTIGLFSLGNVCLGLLPLFRFFFLIELLVYFGDNLEMHVCYNIILMKITMCRF